MVHDFQNMWSKVHDSWSSVLPSVMTKRAIYAHICTEYLWNDIKEIDNSSCLWGEETGGQWEGGLCFTLYFFVFCFKFFSMYIF